MPQFLDRFERVSTTASGAGFWKGLLTAMIELGALLGALNQGWIADKISRKYSIVVAVVIFTIGSALQTGAVDYPMLVIARLIGGVGIGMYVSPVLVLRNPYTDSFAGFRWSLHYTSPKSRPQRFEEPC